MKKVGILTLVGNNNYGNRLQNYALSKKIDSMGFKTETIWICKNKFNAKIKEKSKVLSSLFIKKYKRYYNFVQFTNGKIKNRYSKDINLIKNDYYKFVTGSDQVWNYNFKSFDKNFLLLFSEYNKNISYAASLAVDSITDNFVDLFKNGIKNIRNISVREDKTKDILIDLTKRKDIEVLIDPTMLLTSEEWDKVSKKPRQLKNIKEDKYILNYFLGELSQSRKQEIERIAKENNCHIINILDKEDPFYTCGPSEFLYLEKNAFLICTDSFHSSVFGILYNTPFIVFEREDKAAKMNSRIDTLLSKFKLKNRKFNDKEITKENLNHDYTEAYRILEKERKKSEEFLKKALDIE